MTTRGLSRATEKKKVGRVIARPDSPVVSKSQSVRFRYRRNLIR